MLLALIQSLKLWLELKSITAHWQLTKDIEWYCDHCENQILRARADGDDALADRMRARFARASGIAVPSIGSSAPVQGANVPSTGK